MARARRSTSSLPASLLDDLRRLLPGLEADLRAQSAAIEDRLRGEWQQAQAAKRTAEAFGPWRDAWVTQAAVAWLLSLVFVRYLEDHAFVPTRLAGSAVGALPTAEQADEARAAFIAAHPTLSDADWLGHILSAVAELPGGGVLFGPHNLVRALAPSGDMGGVLLRFFQRTDAEGALVHGFGHDADTRVLGDLYQDLSEDARKRYALLQTPDFVEEFILDHTLDAAIETFGLAQVRLIDPTCGSGHFLLGAFARLLDRRSAALPGEPVRDRVQAVLHQVWGVDVNPFAVAVARFRLLIAALRAEGVKRLADAPRFEVHVTVADSLAETAGPADFHGLLDDPRQGLTAEDRAAVSETFAQHYHVVVGNPPYITEKDTARNQLYRGLFDACHMKYSLGVPFTEQFFRMAEPGGYVGLITANSFMKREFGKVLIERVLPKYDLTHVIDTAGAYIPGHGTPTVIMLGRKRAPGSDVVRAVLGIRGEPSTPAEPARGLVWRSIAEHMGEVGFANEFVSVADLAREVLSKHPWSLGGGGAAELKATLEERSVYTLGAAIDACGVMALAGNDDVFISDDPKHFQRLGVRSADLSSLVMGEGLRDWKVDTISCIYPYDDKGRFQPIGSAEPYLWGHRSLLRTYIFFGRTKEERALDWREWGAVLKDKLLSRYSLAFAFVATHNHFVLNRGGKVFKQSAPVIKLPAEASEADHLALLGLLNASTACFWMKQVFFNKGATSDKGVLQDDPERFRFEFDGTKLKGFPIPALDADSRSALIALAGALDAGGRQLAEDLSFEKLYGAVGDHPDLEGSLKRLEAERDLLRARMVRWQEELDFLVYELYGISIPEACRSLIHSTPISEMPGLDADSRPYRLRDQEGRHPSDWTNADNARHAALSIEGALAMLERPDFKRRWFRSAGAYSGENLSDGERAKHNARTWLLDRLETPAYFPETTRDGQATPTIVSTSLLAARAAEDADFVRVAQVYGGAHVDLPTLVRELVLSEAVPDIAVLRYSEAGLRKRAVWEEVWALQRREDAGEQVAIPVPPTYTSADFKGGVFWGLRGKLDVPKERFTLHPYAQRVTDAGVFVSWAGLDHRQRAQALASLYLERKDIDGWPPGALLPFLTALDQLEPWLFQWHHAPDAAFGGQRMSETFKAFVDGELASLGVDRAAARLWQPEGKRRSA